MHGRGKSWDRVDVDRLVHQLTLDGYLQEKMVPTKQEGIVVSYIKLGPKANELLRGGIKVRRTRIMYDTCELYAISYLL